MASIFFRLLKEDDKGAALRRCIAELRAGQENDLTHTVRQGTFALLPGSPMPYWVSDDMRRKFKELPPFHGNGGAVQRGLFTGDDFRFVRTWWEVPVEGIAIGNEETRQGKRWVLFAKGGEYSPYYADVHLVVNWENDAAEIKAYVTERYPYLKGKTDWVLHPENDYFEPGLTYTSYTVLGFNVRFLPAGCVFSQAGNFIYTSSGDSLWFVLGLFNSRLVQQFLLMETDSRKWEVGYVQNVPWKRTQASKVGELARESHDLKRGLDQINETSHAFTRSALLGLQIAGSEFRVENLEQRFLAWLAVQDAAEVRVIENSYQIDQAVLDLYEISERDLRTIDRELGPHPGSCPHKDNWSTEDDERLRLLYSEERGDLEKIAHALQVHPASVATRRQTLGLYRPDDFAEALADFISYCIGCLFSRWDIRIGAGDREPPSLPDPEEGLPLYPPGALESDSPPLQPAGLLAQIIEHSARHGILVDDPGHKQDIVSGVEASLACLFGEERLPALRTEIEEALGRDLREWLARYFFPFHIKRYSKSRRKAPIYWQLTTSSKGYSLWLYYHTLGSDTLYTGVQEYVTPKIELEEGRLKELQGKCDQVKESSPAREARRLEKALEDQEVFLQELYTFRSELRRLADWGYDPDFDDGVIINIAPLQRLVPWKEAEKMWEKLEAGEYEWSTMAQHMKQHKQKDR
jgi:hypothetical protein